MTLSVFWTKFNDPSDSVSFHGWASSFVTTQSQFGNLIYMMEKLAVAIRRPTSA